MRWSVAALVVSSLLATPTVHAEVERPRSVTELTLPGFQSQALSADLPARDVRFDADGSLWVLGSRSLWQWDAPGRKLRRVRLFDVKKDKTLLQRLGTDGISMLAATANSIYQFNPRQKRIFRYEVPQTTAAGRPLGFFGGGDDTWLVRSDALVRVDRYGKSLQVKAKLDGLAAKDRVVFMPDTQQLWHLAGNVIRRIDTSNELPVAKPVLRSKHRLLNAARLGNGLMVHTAHTVLQLDAAGKLVRSIPVEGPRKIVAMHIDDERHAYLFDDRLLEVFSLKDRKTASFFLPLEHPAEATHLVLRGALAAVSGVDGLAVYRLDP